MQRYCLFLNRQNFFGIFLGFYALFVRKGMEMREEKYVL